VGALKNLPPELVFGWVLWLAGGLVLMRWFRRRSEAPTHSKSTVRHIAPNGDARRPGHRPVAVRPAPVSPDAFTELHTLLDSPDDPPR
jgi:hypothetical protein